MNFCTELSKPQVFPCEYRSPHNEEQAHIEDIPQDDRKIKSVYNFTGLENNKLNYKCKECIKRWFIPINGLIN